MSSQPTSNVSLTSNTGCQFRRNIFEMVQDITQITIKIINRKSHTDTGCRLVSTWMILNDLEQPRAIVSPVCDFLLDLLSD